MSKAVPNRQTWKQTAKRTEKSRRKAILRIIELEAALRRLSDYCAWVADGGMPLELDEAVRDARAVLASEHHAGFGFEASSVTTEASGVGNESGAKSV